MSTNLNRQDMIEKAYRFAVKAHEGQTDKGGKPYIDHVVFERFIELVYHTTSSDLQP